MVSTRILPSRNRLYIQLLQFEALFSFSFFFLGLPRTYEIVLPNLGSDDYGLLPPGGGDSTGSGRSGKIYSFRLIE